MATVVIDKRKTKRGISYRVLYKDPLTFKSKYHKTYRKYKDAQSEASKLRDLLDNGKVPEPHKKLIKFITFSEVGDSIKKAWKQKLLEGDLGHVTYDGYILRLDLLNQTFGSRLLCDITEAGIKAFRLEQLEEQSAATSNRNLFILKQVFKTGLQLKAVVDPRIIIAIFS